MEELTYVSFIVDNKGGVKISDFGISKKVEEGKLPLSICYIYGLYLTFDIDIMQVSSAAHRPSLQGSIFWYA